MARSIITRFAGACRICGGPLPAGAIATFYRTPTPTREWERVAQPHSNIAHRPYCPTTIDLDAQAFLLLLPPDMDPYSTAAWIHLYRLSNVPPMDTPPDVERHYAWLRVEAQRLIDNAFGTWAGPYGWGGGGTQLANVLSEMDAINRRYPGRWGAVCIDVEAWYRMHRAALRRHIRSRARVARTREGTTPHA